MKKPPNAGILTSNTPGQLDGGRKANSIGSDEDKPTQSRLVDAVFKQNSNKPVHSSNLRHNSGNNFGAV
jgi:hypothetical protein